MNPRERRIALVIASLLLPCVAALAWSMRLAAGAPHPGALRAFTHAGADHAAVFFDRALHLFDTRGERLARLPLASLHLTEEPTDMDWTVDAAGKVQAWFFDDTGPRIVRCDLQPAPLQLAGCAEVLRGPQLKARATSHAVHLGVDLRQGRVFVADAQGKTVRAFSLRGQLVGESGPELSFPNRVRVAGEQLLVADNDHRQLAVFGIAGERPGFPFLRTLSLGNHPQAARGRKLADFAFQRTAGTAPPGLWVLAVGQGQKYGQILMFDGDWNPRGAADLGGHTDPLTVDRLGADLLVADFEGVALYRIAPDGRFLGAFGGRAFAQELDAARAQARRALWWKWGAWAGVALTLLLGLALALRPRVFTAGAARSRGSAPSPSGFRPSAPVR